MKQRSGPAVIIGDTIDRRSVLDWLGKAAVVALGAELMAACDLDDASGEPLDAAGDDGGGRGRGLGDGGPGCATSDRLAFAPGSAKQAIFDGWGERTVDEQDLVSILKTWRLRVDGLVDRPLDLGFADLLKLARRDQITDFHCVEGWSIYDVPWNGVHLSTLFDLARPRPSATHVTFHTIGDAYNESLPLSVALEKRTLLAYGIGCATLPLRHGFPVRVVVPRKWAYKNPKYVYRIELDDGPRDGYWVAAGYPYDGDVTPGRLRPGKY